MDTEARLRISRKLAEMGMPVFLVRPGDKRPLHSGWQNEASANPEEVAALVRQHPSANLGVATGGSLIVVDVDTRHSGDRTLRELEALHGPLPKTFTVSTGGGGKHIYLRLPNGYSTKNSAGQLGEGIDTRGEGGYVVGPGSVHPSGGKYEIIDATEALAEAPSWLLDGLKRERDGAKKARASTAPGAPAFGEGRRNTDMFSLAGFMRSKGADEIAIRGALDGLNKKLPTPLPDEEIEMMASGVTRYDPNDFLVQTEKSLADEFAQYAKDRLSYCPAMGWQHYEQGAWRGGAGEQHAQECAKEFVQGLEAKARAMAARQNDLQVADKIVKSALRWQRASSVKNIVKLAESDHEILTAATDFDGLPHLLNLRNGTFNLAEGRLQDHRPADRLRKQANVAFDPTATCPLFDNFLEEVLGTDKSDFLLRAVAYSLLGKPTEQKMFVLTGAGRNGKTTLTELLREMLGDYSLVLDPASLLKKNTPTIGNDIARLDGARFALTSEFSRGAQIDIPLVKKLTGNESISARFLYKEAFQFDSKAVFFLVTNHNPSIDGSDFALIRRLVVIPFDVVVPAERVDRELKAKLMMEAPGIFNRLLGALGAYRQVGLHMPKSIKSATDQYAQEHDKIAQFLAHECKMGSEHTVGANALFSRFRTYCFDNGLAAMNERNFKKTLETKGHTQKRVAAGIVWTGLALEGLPSRLRAA